MRCDGDSDEQIDRAIELAIITTGWAVQCVEPAAGDPGGAHWAYTIGLHRGFELPELVVTDLVHPRGGRFLHWAARELSTGRPLDDLRADGVGWRRVHHDHLMTGLVSVWEDHTRESPVSTPFVQLVPPVRPGCPCCPPVVADLSDPDDGFPDNRGLTLAT